MVYVCPDCEGDLRVTCSTCSKVGITQQEYDAMMNERNPNWKQDRLLAQAPTITVTPWQGILPPGNGTIWCDTDGSSWLYNQ